MNASFLIVYQCAEDNESAYIYADSIAEITAAAFKFVEDININEGIRINSFYILGVSDSVIGYHRFFRVKHSIDFEEETE